MTVVYCIDTSSMIDAGERYYPIDVFPGFWDKLDTLIQSGRLKAPKTLLDELEGKDEKWREWVYARADKMIWPIDAAIQAALHQVMPIYAANVTNVNSIKGDPFFVAASLAFKATLITSEKKSAPRGREDTQNMRRGWRRLDHPARCQPRGRLEVRRDLKFIPVVVRHSSRFALRITSCI